MSGKAHYFKSDRLCKRKRREGNWEQQTQQILLSSLRPKRQFTPFNDFVTTSLTLIFLSTINFNYSFYSHYNNIIAIDTDNTRSVYLHHSPQCGTTCAQSEQPSQLSATSDIGGFRNSIWSSLSPLPYSSVVSEFEVIAFRHGRYQ